MKKKSYAPPVVQSQACGLAPTACVCACPEGPCEHIWDGEERTAYREASGARIVSASCSRCGMASLYHHRMR